MDLQNRGGCQGCLALVSAIFTILASAVSILAYFYGHAGSLFEALSQFTPSLSAFLAIFSDSVGNFAVIWPLGPLVSALLVFVIVIVLRFVSEQVFDILTIDITFSDIVIQIVIFSPFVILWMLLFSEVISIFGTTVFVVGYFLSVVSAAFIAAEFG